MELEQENSRLKKLVADLSLDNVILKEASRGGSLTTPSAPSGNHPDKHVAAERQYQSKCP